jgi:WD40 repeat protein
MTSPYVGLDYFGEADASLFFGRDAERTRLIGNLRASRLTLLYAQSGVGKSSLLRAGVAARLREIAHARRETRKPLYVPVVFSGWHGDPLPALIDELEAAMRDVAPDIELPRDSLQAALGHASKEAKATPLMMFDQFEEYFLYHPEDVNDGFADELATCVTTSDLSAHFLISIREDSYSRIGDRFSTRIPHVFANYLHLDYLDEASARQAITRPLDQLNANRNGSPELSIEYELVDEVLRQVRRPSSEDGDESRFETPYLQLVMERLWNEDGASGNLRLATLESLGGAAKIVRGHLEDAMAALPDDQRAAAAGALRFLVTSGGSKIALTAAELSELAGIPETALAEPLEWLDQRRVLRRVASSQAGPRYELFHDVLGDPVIEWRKHYEQQVEADRQAAQLKAEAAAKAARIEAEDRQRLEKERARHRSQIVLVSGVLLGLLVCALVTLVLVVRHQADEANAESRKARAQALAAGAISQLDANPRLSVLLAREAWDVDHTQKAREALRLSVAAFSRTRTRSVVRFASKRFNAFADHDGRSVAILTAPNSARIWDLANGEWRSESTLRLPGRIASVVWSADDSTVLVAGRSGAIVLRLGGTPVTLTPRAVRSADLDHDGRFAAVAIGDAVTTHDTRTGDRLAVTRPGPQVRQVAFVPDRDGVLGMATCADRNVRLWNWRANRVRVLHRPKERVTHPRRARSVGSCVLAFSPDGRFLATAVRTDSPRIWSVRTGKYKTRVDTYSEQVKGLQWSDDGRALLVASAYGFQAYKPFGGLSFPKELDTSDSLSRALETTTAATIGPDGRTATGDEAGGIVMGSLDRNASTLLSGHTDRIIALKFVTGDRLMSIGADGTVRFWDATPPKDLLRMGEDDMISAVAFRPDVGQVAVGTYGGGPSRTGAVHLLDPADAKRNGRLPVAATAGRKGTGSWITETSYLRDGRLIVARSFVGRRRDSVRLVDPRTRKSQPIKVPSAFEVRKAAATGDLAVLIPSDGPPAAIDMRTNDRLKLEDWPSGVNARSIEVSRDGGELLIGGDDGRARIFSAATREQIAEVGMRGGAMSGAISSPDGKYVLTYGGDRLGHLWNVRTKAEVATLRGHTGRITSAAFSRDGRLIVTGGADGTTRIWQRDGRKVVVDRSHNDAVLAVAFDPHGRGSILTASSDGAVTPVQCESCGSFDSVERLARRVRGKLTERERRDVLD